MNDHELLCEYTERQSEPAFAELVARHVDLVYSTALRLAGERQFAQDVVQAVFLQLARKAGTVRNHQALASWLYRVTHAAAMDAMRREHRRRVREQEAMKLSEQEGEAPAAWAAVAPLLDEAMRRLKPAELDAVVLRFFEGKSLREVGEALALSEDGAQKRVSRALEKLRAYFGRRGVTATAALLGEAIASNSVQAAPAGLAGRVAGPALAGAGSGGVGGWLGKIFGLGPKGQAVGAAAVILGAAVPLVWQYQDNAQLRGEVAAAQQAQGQLEQGNASAWSGARGGGGAQARLSDAEIEAQVRAAVAMRRKNIDLMLEDADGYAAPWYPRWSTFLNSANPADLPRVLAHIEPISYTATREGLRTVTLGIWARSNAPAAMAYAQAISETGERDYSRENAMRNVLEEWVKRDLSGAEAWMEQQPADKTRDYMLVTLADALAQKNPQVAFDYVNSHGGGTSYMSVVYEALFRNWAVDDYPRMAEQVAGMPAAERNTMVQGFGEGWGIIDPTAAAAWVGNFTSVNGNATEDLGFKESFERGMLAHWADSDPKSALDWAGQLMDDDERKSAYGEIVQAVARNGSKAVQEYVEAMPAGTNRDELQDAAMQSWVPGDPQALAAIAAMPEGKAKDNAILGMVNNAARGTVAFQGVPADKSDIVAWVATFPDEALRLKAYLEIMGGWSRTDPAAAEVWMRSLPAGTERDAVAYRFFVYNDTKYPAQMAPWVESMAKGTQRNIMQNNTALAWLNVDRPAAAAWIAQSSLFSEKQKEHFLGKDWNAAK